MSDIVTDELRAAAKRIRMAAHELIAEIDRLNQYRKAHHHAIECVDRVFQCDSKKPPPILPEFCRIGDDKFEAVVRLARAYVEQQREIDRLRAENAKLKNGIASVHALINESFGVAGLHLNGDIATWEELRTGGRFAEWLDALDVASDVAKERL